MSSRVVNSPLLPKDELQVIFRRLGFTPNKHQAEALYDPSRYKLVMGGVRAGKSLTGAAYLAAHASMTSNGLFWVVGTTYALSWFEFKQCLDLLVGICNLAETHGSRENPPFSLTTRSGSTISSHSADDPRTLAGEAPHGIVGCEVGVWPEYETFLRVIERTSEKRGWLYLSGSFESSSGWLPEKFKQWQTENEDGGRSFSLPTHTNTVIYPGGENDPEILRLKAIYPENRFMERFMGVPCPPTGAVFPDFRATHHIRSAAEFTPELPVEIWIDPGYNVYSVLAVQFRGEGRVSVIDELYLRGLTTEEIISLCTRKPWWKRVEGGVIDVAAKQHHAQRSVLEIWYNKAGITLRTVRVGIEDGIDRLHTFLRPNPLTGVPDLMVHPRCRGLISEFGAGVPPLEGGGVYRYKTDEAGVSASDKPIDAHNHSIKALTYGLYFTFGAVSRKPAEMGPVSYMRKR